MDDKLNGYCNRLNGELKIVEILQAQMAILRAFNSHKTAFVLARSHSSL